MLSQSGCFSQDLSLGKASAEKWMSPRLANTVSPGLHTHYSESLPATCQNHCVYAPQPSARTYCPISLHIRTTAQCEDLLPRFLNKSIKSLPDIKYLAKVTVGDCVLNSYIRPHCPLVFLDDEYKVAGFFPVMLY